MSSDVDQVTAGGRGSDREWSLASTRPGPLVARLTTAAVGAAAVGGTATTWLFLAFAEGPDNSPIAWVLVIGMPLTLIVMIIARLVVVSRWTRSAPFVRWLIAVATVNVALIIGTRLRSETDWTGHDLTDLAATASVTALVGTVFGLIPATASLAVLIPALLLLRVRGPRIGRGGAQLLVTVVPMIATALFVALLLTDQAPGAVLVSSIPAALAGACAMLSVRWILG